MFTKTASIFVAILVAGFVVQAETVTLNFQGTFDSSTVSGINAGDSFTYVFSYDDTTADSEADSTRGVYDAGVLSMNLYINSVLTDNPQSNGELQMTNDRSGEDGFFYASNGSTYSIELRLRDESATAHASDAIAGVFPNLSDYSHTYFTVYDFGEDKTASGTVSAVPEPATAGLLGISGLIVYALRRINNFNRPV